MTCWSNQYTRLKFSLKPSLSFLPEFISNISRMQRNTTFVLGKNILKINSVGIIGCIIAFVSIMFPWYSILTQSYMNNTLTQFYLFMKQSPIPEFFEGWTPQYIRIITLIFVLAGGMLGIVGSLKKKTRILFSGAICIVLSLMLFAGVIVLNGGLLFGNRGGLGEIQYYYLDIGYWLATISAIILFSSLAINAKNKAIISAQQQH